MESIRDSSASVGNGAPTAARKMQKQAVTKSYKERLRRYGKVRPY
jgi:hypothetical protein